MPATLAEEASTAVGTPATTAKKGLHEYSTVYRGTATTGPTAALEITRTKQHL
jgi:hypothetical protein